MAYRTVTKPYARSQKQISLPKQPASPSEHDPNHIGLTTSTDAHPPTQTTRCVFKQPLQPNRATIISNPRESHSIPSSRSSPKKKQTKPNQTKPNHLNKNQTHLPCSSNPQKTSTAPQPSSDSAAEELRIAGATEAGIASTCRRRTDLHLGMASESDPMGWGEEGHQLVPLFSNGMVWGGISWSFSRLVRCFFTITQKFCRRLLTGSCDT